MAIDKIFNDANVDGIADNIFGAVNNSVSEVKQMQQRKAAENVQMVIQALKKIESDLRQTNEEVANELATRIASIKNGKDGKDGNNAKDGRDGRPGRDGAKGDKGDRGLDGRNGIDGKDGVSVTDAKIDFDGSLIISLSTGQEINVGEVVSPDLADKIQVISTMSTNGAVGIKDEGTSITAGVKNINFVGATVTATNSGDDVTVNVSSGTGTVTSVAATVPSVFSISGSPITTSGTLALTYSGTALPVANGGTGLTAGTSGGVLAYTAAGTLASSGALTASALVIGGGAGVAPSTTTTGTGVVTALGVNTGTAGAFVVNGGALGTPSSGIVTNLTGTASININGTVGATTPATGAFTTLSATGTSTLVTVNTTGDITSTNATNGQLAFRFAGSTVDVHVRPNAGKYGVLSFTEDAVSDRWAIGTKPADGSLYFSSTNTAGFAAATPIVTILTSGLAVTGTLSATTTGKVGTTLGVGAATPSASGAGITFPATQSASTDANTLDDYEEGTWTPNQGSGLTVVGTFSSSGKYTKIGNMVFLQGVLSGSTSIACTNGGAITSNMPFTSTTTVVGLGGFTNSNGTAGGTTDCGPSSTTISATPAIAATATVYFSLTYQTT